MKQLQQNVGAFIRTWQNRHGNMGVLRASVQFVITFLNEARSMEYGIRRNILEQYKKTREDYVKQESDCRKKLDESPHLTRYRFKLYAGELKSKQDLVQRNQKVIEELEQLLRELLNYINIAQHQIFEIENGLQLRLTQRQQGLTAARIQQFQQFAADESLVGCKCSICQDVIEAGRKMMRLDCNGHHVFCQDCIEGWLSDHNTCPNCRHVFL